MGVVFFFWAHAPNMTLTLIWNLGIFSPFGIFFYTTEISVKPWGVGFFPNTGSVPWPWIQKQDFFFVKFDSFLKRNGKNPVSLQQQLKIFHKFRDFLFLNGIFLFLNRIFFLNGIILFINGIFLFLNRIFLFLNGIFLFQRDFFISQLDFFYFSKGFFISHRDFLFLNRIFLFLNEIIWHQQPDLHSVN